MLNIHYFASLREELGQSSDTLDLPEGAGNVADLIAHLIAQHGERCLPLADSSRVLVAVNQTIVERSHPLTGNEEVAFFPPMTGG